VHRDTARQSRHRSNCTVFRFLRIAVLLYVLAFVAVGTFITARETTRWERPLRVAIHPINADSSETARAWIERLRSEDFAPIESFIAEEAHRYGVAIEKPFRLELAPELVTSLPRMPADSSLLETVIWSLRVRWLSARLRFDRDGPSPDITLFAAYHAAERDTPLERSGALRKGLVVIAHLYAQAGLEGSNHVVVTHELLHTLGATDKYDPATTMPVYPDGFAAPDSRPLYPQQKAEIMGGRVPVAPRRAEIPLGLESVVVGPLTAAEIGWRTR
jgi:hypothetical protein